MLKIEFFLSLFLILNLTLAIDLTDLTSSQVFSILGTNGNSYEFHISNAGDTNKDGKDDLLMGAYGSKESAFLIYGTSVWNPVNINFATPTLSPTSAGVIITKTSNSDGFGAAVSGAGDIDGDGYADIVIGAYRKNSYSGQAYVIYGGPSISSNIDANSLNPALNGFTISTTTGGDTYLGSSVSKAGNVNKDAYNDIVVGISGLNSKRGAAIVVYGASTGADLPITSSTAPLIPTSRGFSILGNAAGDYFGSSVSNIGDINKDGYDDIIVGATKKNGNQGAAYVIYGSQSPVNIDLSSQTLIPATTGFTILGNAASDSFGCSLSGAGDVNGDGIPDIIVGACNKESNKGVAYVIYGRKTPANINLLTETLLPATTGFMVFGSASNGKLGSSVKSVGDLNNDGYDDVIIGAPGQGAVHVIYGGGFSDIDLSSVILDPTKNGFTIAGSSAESFGFSVDSGDFDDDDKTELFVGTLGSSNSQAAAGYIINLDKMCSDNCDSCSVPSTCEICSANYEVVTSTLKCRECNAIGEYYSNSQCNSCISNCDTCSDSNSCQVCSQGYGRRNSKCVACPQESMYFSNGECLSCSEGCLQCQDVSVCQVCASNYMLSEWNLCIERKEDAQTKGSSSAFEGASLVGSSLTSGSSLSLNFGLVAKILRNVKYLNITVSPDLRQTFLSWKVTSGFLSAPESWSSESVSEYLPVVFSRYDLASIFLINYWKTLIMALIGFAIFVIFKIMEILFGKGSRWGSIVRSVNVAASNFALNQFYSNLDDVIFYLTLDLRSTKFDTPLQVSSFFLGLLLLFGGVIVIGVHMWLLWKYQSLKRKNLNPCSSNAQLEGFQLKHENISLLFKDFKDLALLTQSYLLVNVIRCLISSIIVALLFEYPLLQIILLLTLNIIMIIFLLVKRSFKDVLNTCGQLFCEFILLVANICMFVMSIFGAAGSKPLDAIEKLSKCIIILNIILLIGCVVFLVLSIVMIFYVIYQDKKKAKNKTVEIALPKNTLNDKLGELRLSYPRSQTMMMPEKQNNIEHNNQNTIHRTYKWSVTDSNGIIQQCNEMNYQNSSFNNSKNYNEISQGNSSNSMVYGNQVEDFINTSNANLISNSYLTTSPQKKILKSKRGRIKMPEGTKHQGYLDYQKRLSGGDSYHSGISNPGQPQNVEIGNLEKLNNQMEVQEIQFRRKTQMGEDIIVEKMRESGEW